MRVIPIQTAYSRKFSRQTETPGVKLDSGGLCAHVGKISSGCYWCFSPTALSWGVHLGRDAGLPNLCNLKCPYCFGCGTHGVSPMTARALVPDAWELSEEARNAALGHVLSALSASGPRAFLSFAFSGDGAEPLLYLPVIRAYMRFYKQVLQPAAGLTAQYKLYTNGSLADRDTMAELAEMGFTEIRFHLGAMGFGEDTFERLAFAAGLLPRVTVETPAWPPHKEQLLAALPRLEACGVRHLNLIEVAITEWNLETVEAAFGIGEIYHSGVGLALDDGGLVYELMAAVHEQRLSFSVLDCSSLVRKIRDERTWNGCFRGALSKIGYGSDWPEYGLVPGGLADDTA